MPHSPSRFKTSILCGVALVGIVVCGLLVQGIEPTEDSEARALPAATGQRPAVVSSRVALPTAMAVAPALVQTATPGATLERPPLPPYGAAADPAPRDGGKVDSTRISVQRVAGAEVDAALLRFLKDALPPDVADRIRRDGVSRYVSDEREPMIPFASLNRLTAECAVLSQLGGIAVLRIGESGRVLGARMLSDPAAAVPEAVYACEFGPIANDGSHSIFQTLTPAPGAGAGVSGGRF